MAISFINSFHSEWIKKRRSLAAWLVFGAAFFTPTIILLVRIKNRAVLPKLHAANDFWPKLWTQSWESMAVMLLPMSIMLAAGLIAQLEYKNNAWKQLHTTPQRYAVIYCAKFAVLLVMVAQLFVLFNVGMYLSGVVPALLFSNAPYPAAPMPLRYFLTTNARYFVDCLPVMALQFAMSLYFRNFLVPLGVGFGIWVLGVGGLSWEYSYIFPYLLCGIDFFKDSGHIQRQIPVNIQTLALAYFTIFTLVGYLLYSTRKEKG